MLERLALSKDALKMNGPAILRISRGQEVDVLFAFDHAGTGDQRQRLAVADLNLRIDFDDHDLTADASRRNSGRSAGSRMPSGAAFAVLQRGADEGFEQGMRLERLGFELGMELAAEIPGMAGELADFDVDAVRGFAGEAQAVLLSGCLHIRD